MAGFGEGVRKRILRIFDEEVKKGKLPSSEEMLLFTEQITDLTLSKDLSYRILDAIAKEDNALFLELVLKEYSFRALVISASLREYPDLFNRRIYFPIRLSMEEFVIALLASLRITDNEDVYLMFDNKRYTLKGERRIKDISIFDIKGEHTISLVYGADSWTFDITLIGLTYLRENEIDMPYLVEDAVGYGIMGVRKYRLFDMLDESKELSTDTKNPIMDDEEFEFYNADTDSLNEEAISEFARLMEVYLGE